MRIHKLRIGPSTCWQLEKDGRAGLLEFSGAGLGAIRAAMEAKEKQDTRPKDHNPLKNAPHTTEALLVADWPHPYSREQAAYPVAGLRRQKYWSPVGRVDNVWGDRNLFCSCVPIADYAA